METQQVALTICEESQGHLESHRAQRINEWLLKFAVAYPAQGSREPVVTKETAPMLAGIWSEALADVHTEALEPAFRATLKNSKWFPTVADIREHIDSAYESLAEDEWQNLLEYCRKWVNRDTARDNPPPRLPADIDHAARAAGGVLFLEACSEKDLVFAKQRFVEDLTRQRKSGELAAFLPSSDLRKLLTKAAARISLPPFPVPAPPPRAIPSEQNQTSYGSLKERDPAFAAMVEAQEEKFAASNERILSEWRKVHGINAGR